MAEPTRIEDEPEAVAEVAGIAPYFNIDDAEIREQEIRNATINAHQASKTPIKPYAFEENSTPEIREEHEKRVLEYRKDMSPPPEPALRDDQDLELVHDEEGNVTGYEVVDRPLIWQAGDLVGDLFTGTAAGSLISVDETAQFFVNTANLFSEEPEDDIRFFSYLGDWLMQDAGAAKTFGRDIGRFMTPFLGWLKLARIGIGTVSTAKVFDKAPRFIAGAKGVKDLPKVNKANIKKAKMQNWLKKDLTAGQLAYLLTGGTGYDPDEMGGGLAALKAIDGALGGKVNEFLHSDDKTNARKRLENAIGEHLVMTGIDKYLLPVVKQLGLKAHNWTTKPLAAKIVAAIDMEKHVLNQKQRILLNAQGQAKTFLSKDEQTGLLKVTPREDGSIEFITQERMGHGFRQIIRSKEEMAEHTMSLAPQDVAIQQGVLAVEFEGKVYTGNIGDKFKSFSGYSDERVTATLYTHADVIDANDLPFDGVKGGFVTMDGKFVESSSVSLKGAKEQYRTLPELQDNIYRSQGRSLEKLKEMWDDGSLQERMDTAPTLMEKVAVANDIIEVIENAAKAPKVDSGKVTTKDLWGDNTKTGPTIKQPSRKSIKEMRKEADKILYNMWGENLMGLLNRQKGNPVNDAIAIAYTTAAKSSHDELILALQAVVNMSADGTAQQIAHSTSNMFRTLHNYAGLREQLKDVKKVWGRTGNALRFSQERFEDILESPSFAKIMQEAEGATQEDTMRLALALTQSFKEQGGIGLAKAVESFGQSGFTAGFMEGWIGLGLLGNPALQMLNIATGLLNIQATIASRAISGVGSTITGHGDVQMGEAMAGVYGVLTSLFTAIKLGTRAAITGKTAPAFTGAKMENYTGLRHLTAENANLENYSIGLGIDFIGRAARFTNRLLLGGDEFVKVCSYECERAMLSYRHAMKELGGWDVLAKGDFDYKKFSSRVEEVYNNPKKYLANESGQTIHERGLEQGLLNVLQQKLGKAGKMVQNLQNNVPWVSPIVKLHAPFVKVLSNIPKLAVRYSPLSGLNWFGANSLFKAAPSVRMEEIGRLSYGTMMMWIGSQLYSNGMLTDSGESEWSARRIQTESDVAPPMSLRHVDDHGGKYWVDLSRVQPWSNILTAGADASKMIETYDERTIGEHIWKSVWSMKQMLSNTSWMPNMHKLLELAASDKIEPWEFQNTANSLISSLTQPAVVRSIAKAHEPMKPEYKTFHIEPENPFEGKPQDFSGISARMMGVSTGRESVLYQARNYNGDKIDYHETEQAAKKGVTPFGLPHLLTGGVLSFMHVREDKSDAVDKEIVKIRLPIAKPSDIVNEPSTNIPIRMKAYEYDYFTEQIGKVKIRGLTQKGAWRRVMNSDEYKKADVRSYDKTHPSKEEQMMDIHRVYKKRAKEDTIARFRIYDRASTILDRDKPPVAYAPRSQRKSQPSMDLRLELEK